MKKCEFIPELNRLKKSSKDSIDALGSFDKYKNYMHIKRNVERDLKELLK